MFGPQTVLFAHREGKILEDFGSELPPMVIVGCNTDGDGVSTLALRPAKYTRAEIDVLGQLRAQLRAAIRQRDLEAVAYVATISAQINQRHLALRAFNELEAVRRRSGALGLQIAHSGTVAGLIFDPDSSSVETRAADASLELKRVADGPCWLFETGASNNAESTAIPGSESRGEVARGA
jgi:uncharacterized protein involved in propanediol utilization